ncbi:hypothetical protein DINM_007238 [Dirofilaria immitis]|nr:hypothetical protein [Dirofilaria immitis]
MDLVIDEITTERVKIIINEEGAVLSIISYILRTYAYLVIGTLLILINIPIFVLVITCKKLRDRYLVLVVVFLNNGFTGISAILSAMRRLINSANGERYIDHHECVLNYIITIIAITSTVVASLIEPSRQVSDFCLLQVTYLSEFYSTLLLLSTAASLLSVILMLIVVIILRKKFGVQYLSTHSHNLDLSYFLKNQKRYTHTALISCCFTFFLAVVPSTIQYIYVLDPSAKSRTVVIACVYLPFLNSLNMIIWFVCRQGDLRRALEIIQRMDHTVELASNIFLCSLNILQILANLIVLLAYFTDSQLLANENIILLVSLAFIDFFTRHYQYRKEYHYNEHVVLGFGSGPAALMKSGCTITTLIAIDRICALWAPMKYYSFEKNRIILCASFIFSLLMAGFDLSLIFILSNGIRPASGCSGFACFASEASRASFYILVVSAIFGVVPGGINGYAQKFSLM